MLLVAIVIHNTDVMAKQGTMMPWHFYHLAVISRLIFS